MKKQIDLTKKLEAYDKIKKCIASCTHVQHIIVCRRMITLFREMYVKDGWDEYYRDLSILTDNKDWSKLKH